MAEEKQQTKLLTVVAPYAIVVSMLYLFGYWSSFGINILEYVSFQDLLKLAIYPLFIGSITVLTGILVRVFLFDLDHIRRDEKEKVFFTPSPAFERWSKVAAVIGIALVIVFLKDPAKWVLADMLATYTLLISVDDIDILRPLFPNSIVRRLVIAVSIIVLSGAFGSGRENAHLILSGKRARIISTETFREKGNDLLKSKGLLEGQQTIKYLGSAGDYFFFISMDNSKTYIIKYSDLYFLELSDLKQ